MASQLQASADSSPPASLVGNAFVNQYYHILHQSPELVFRFYEECSKLGRPEIDGTMNLTTTLHGINEKILSLAFSDFRAEVTTVDAQESLGGGVLVLVTGSLIGKDNERRSFVQSFFLSPQQNGYFVLNDVFRYSGNAENNEEKAELLDEMQGIRTPTTPEYETEAVEPHVSESLEDAGDGVGQIEVVENNVYENSEDVEEKSITEGFSETRGEIHALVSPSSSAEEIPKRSYASVVKDFKDNSPPVSGSDLTPVTTPISKPLVTPPPPVSAPSTDIQAPSANMADSNGGQETDGEHYSVYIKNLPMDATPAQLEEEFRRFGAIKNGGVQVRSNRSQGFCFGFVEFLSSEAMQSAIRASPIIIGDRHAQVEEKRASGSRVNNRTRFQGGRNGGFRNDLGRPRGNYVGGGRNYNRDYNHRTDFINRGNSRMSFSGRMVGNGVGYQRVDHTGNHDDSFNNESSARGTTPQVPATA